MSEDAIPVRNVQRPLVKKLSKSFVTLVLGPMHVSPAMRCSCSAIDAPTAFPLRRLMFGVP